MALETAKTHFEDAIVRADGLLDHGNTLPAGTLQDDLYRGAWMMAAGAADAYFCDAYADLLSRVLRAKELQPGIILTDRLKGLKLPVQALIGTSKGWRWRMAARELVERESVLSLKAVKDFLRTFCRASNLLLTEGTIDGWISHADSTKRLMGVTRNNYVAMGAPDRTKARKAAGAHMDRRVTAIFQRRHDCIHACDRPKTALQPLSAVDVQYAIKDLTFVTRRCHDHLVAEFPNFLDSMGATGVTKNQVQAG